MSLPMLIIFCGALIEINRMTNIFKIIIISFVHQARFLAYFYFSVHLSLFDSGVPISPLKDLYQNCNL